MVFLPVITDIVFQWNRQVFVREVYSCVGLIHCRFRLGFYKKSSGFMYRGSWVSHLRHPSKVCFFENEWLLWGSNKCRHSISLADLGGCCFDWCLSAFRKLWVQLAVRIGKTSSSLFCIDIWKLLGFHTPPQRKCTTRLAANTFRPSSSEPPPPRLQGRVLLQLIN